MSMVYAADMIKEMKRNKRKAAAIKRAADLIHNLKSVQLTDIQKDRIHQEVFDIIQPNEQLGEEMLKEVTITLDNNRDVYHAEKAMKLLASYVRLCKV